MSEVEKTIQKAQVALAELTQLCRGQQRALDEAAFALTSAAHDAGFMPMASSHYDPDTWPAAVCLATTALRMRDPIRDQWPTEILKECAAKFGYNVVGVEWVTRRAVDLALTKRGSAVVQTFQVRAGDHSQPLPINDSLLADLGRQLFELGGTKALEAIGWRSVRFDWRSMECVLVFGEDGGTMGFQVSMMRGMVPRSEVYSALFQRLERRVKGLEFSLKQDANEVKR